jgi:hypothetical protein
MSLDCAVTKLGCAVKQLINELYMTCLDHMWILPTLRACQQHNNGCCDVEVEHFASAADPFEKTKHSNI